MRKALAGLFVVLALTVLMVPLVSGNAGMHTNTTLEVWNKMSAVTVEMFDGVCHVFFFGEIGVKNVGEYPAYIDSVVGYVEAKWKNQDWATLAEHDFGYYVIDPGETVLLAFDDVFEKGIHKAYRNVVEVHLLNHPSGEHWFHYRESFEVPEC